MTPGDPPGSMEDADAVRHDAIIVRRDEKALLYKLQQQLERKIKMLDPGFSRITEFK